VQAGVSATNITRACRMRTNRESAPCFSAWIPTRFRPDSHSHPRSNWSAVTPTPLGHVYDARPTWHYTVGETPFQE